MIESSNSLDGKNLEELIQFASKAETTSQLQSYWFNRYSEAINNKLFNISESTITNLLQADEVQKPITPFASVNIVRHLDNNAGNYSLNEGKLQSTLDVVVRLLDAVLDSVNFNTEAKFLVDEYRKVGVSINDFNKYIELKKGEKSYEIDYIGSLISNGCYRSSESLAEEKGVCQGWEMINKVIKPISFEYWFNIDTGEIKSGKEISQEFDSQSIKNSKFEIVPRRNSHILLLSDSIEWKEWNDRDNIFNIKPINFVESDKEIETKETVVENKVSDKPDFEKVEVAREEFESKLEEKSLQGDSLGGINVKMEEKTKEVSVDDEMVDLDNLISNINDDSIKQQELFNPIINESENDINPVKVEEDSFSSVVDTVSDDKKSGGFMSKLFANPFSKTEDKSELKDEPISPDKVGENMNEQEDDFDSEVSASIVDSNDEGQEHEYSVGELVKITDSRHPKFNQYLQVIETNKDSVILLDGNSESQETASANFSQIEPASIEQVLGQLNNTYKITEDDEPSQLDNNSESVQKDVESYHHEESSREVKILLFTNNNEVLVLNNKGRISLPSVSFNETDSASPLAISELLFTNYNISNISDLSSSGTYTDVVDQKEYEAYFGFIDHDELEIESLEYLNIVDAYNKSSDVTSILDNMSDSQRDMIENNTTNNQEEEIMTQENNNQEEKVEIMQNVETEQISHEPKKINVTKIESSPVENQTVTYFPQNNQNTNNITNNNNHMLYQSTSKTASYSKFSVLVKQIINTAEFGAIVLHVHYDTTGPKVLTVELPQLINDSVLQILRTYINLINASMIRGSNLSSTVGLIKDQLDLAGENGSVTDIVDIILKGINALPKSIQDFNSTRVLSLDAETSKNIVKTGIDPLKALAEKFINN